jgi:hypothetical protein
MARALLAADGLFIGSSSAMNCVGALRVAQALGARNLPQPGQGRPARRICLLCYYFFPRVLLTSTRAFSRQVPDIGSSRYGTGFFPVSPPGVACSPVRR